MRTAGRGWPQMPRDLAISSMRGTMWTYDAEGVRRYPMQAASKVSESLDVLAQVEGMMLVRSGSLWVPIAPGDTTGKVLTWNNATKLPTWEDAGGAGGFYTPPSVGDFTTGVNASGASFVQAPTGPAVFIRPNPNATNRMNGFVKSLPSPPMTYILGCHWVGTTAQDAGPCLIVGDSSAGKYITLGCNRTNQRMEIEGMVDKWNSPTSHNSEPGQANQVHNGPVFYTLEDNGTTFTFRYGAEAAGWTTLLSESRTAFLSSPDVIGMGFRNRGFDTRFSRAIFIHWDES